MGASASEKLEYTPEKATASTNSTLVTEKRPQLEAGRTEQDSGKATSSSLPALPAPIGVHPDYVFDDQVVLVMREGSSHISDQFRIATTSGQEILTMNSKFWSWDRRKEFRYPHTNQLLFTLHSGLTSFFETYYLQDVQGMKFLRIDCRWSYFRARFDVKFTNRVGKRKGQPVVLNVEGDWSDRCANIMWADRRVARLDRKVAGSTHFWAPLTYGVEVAAGMDVSLIVAIVVALDQRRKSRDRSDNNSNISSHG